jgi:hypothetical protein
MTHKLLSVFVLLFTLTSCSKHLDRSEAKKQIAATLKYPSYKEYYIPKSFSKDMHTEGYGVTAEVGSEDARYIEQMVALFASQNLVSLQETQRQNERSAAIFGTALRTWISVAVTLSDEGKKYVLKETPSTYTVKLWDTDVDKVTGIQETEQSKTSLVGYTVTNKNVTPFGINFNDKDDTLQKTAYFSLFDDGWRIAQH